MTDKLIALTTCANREEAHRIARTLVSRRLAACVNIVGPIQSVYRWKESIEEANEFLLLIKTRQELFAPVHDTVSELHSYELPEMVALRIEHGDEQYLDWIGAETT